MTISPCLQDYCVENWEVSEEWTPIVQSYLQTETGQHLRDTLKQELSKKVQIYPPHPFRALRLCPLPKVKVVIIGQDPYHQEGKADGLAFSISSNYRNKRRDSLQNIWTEYSRSLKTPRTNHTDLTGWAQNGVLLLNYSLTVQANLPNSHAHWGWGVLLQFIVDAILQRPKAPCVFLLWGNFSQQKLNIVPDYPHILVLRASHPSPFSAYKNPNPFMGCNHFSLTQDFLQQFESDWRWETNIACADG
ncbi:MAG: uracil-DNA glycosylase [Gammaproteobacteria bacterium]|nr:uracil-DNA glycosylase [Gammaproteobacteria bacterium]